MPRGLKTKLKTNILPKVEKGVAPMVKPMKSKALPFASEHKSKVVPTIKPTKPVAVVKKTKHAKGFL